MNPDRSRTFHRLCQCHRKYTKLAYILVTDLWHIYPSQFEENKYLKRTSETSNCMTQILLVQILHLDVLYFKKNSLQFYTHDQKEWAPLDLL